MVASIDMSRCLLECMPTTKQAKLEVYILTFGSRAPHNFTYKIARIVRRNECITIPHDIVWYLDAEKLDLGINSLFVFESSVRPLFLDQPNYHCHPPTDPPPATLKQHHHCEAHQEGY